MRHSLAHPLAPFVLFSLALAALFSTYLMAGSAPSPTFETLASIFSSWLLALWIVADARRRHDTPCFDFGFFCYLFMPVLVIWHCFWSRGWRGALMLALIAAIWLAPYVIAGAVWQVLYG